MKGSVEKNYAQALFELAEEENCLNSVYEEIDGLEEIVSENPELVKLLTAPTMSGEERQDVLDRTFKGRISEITFNFLCVMTMKGRFASFCAAADFFRDKYNEYANVAEITVTTAIPLSDAQRDKLTAKWSSLYKKKVIVNEVVDGSILGGMIVRYGNTLLDGSVKSRLEGIKESIKSTIA